MRSLWYHEEWTIKLEAFIVVAPGMWRGSGVLGAKSWPFQDMVYTIVPFLIKLEKSESVWKIKLKVGSQYYLEWRNILNKLLWKEEYLVVLSVRGKDSLECLGWRMLRVLGVEGVADWGVSGEGVEGLWVLGRGGAGLGLIYVFSLWGRACHIPGYSCNLPLSDSFPLIHWNRSLVKFRIKSRRLPQLEKYERNMKNLLFSKKAK